MSAAPSSDIPSGLLHRRHGRNTSNPISRPMVGDLLSAHGPGVSAKRCKLQVQERIHDKTAAGRSLRTARARDRRSRGQARNQSVAQHLPPADALPQLHAACSRLLPVGDCQPLSNVASCRHPHVSREANQPSWIKITPGRQRRLE
jgi:hypothetical protein